LLCSAKAGAPIILIKECVRAKREAKFGRIVSESSRRVLGKTQLTVYAASKAAIIGMARFGVAPMSGGAGRHAITPQNP
jgi:NAD(P)-dependent dehydrogenase (short-subunit alcohol dehydrogenase family)